LAVSCPATDDKFDDDVTQLWSYGTNAYLSYSDGEAPATLRRRVERYAKYVVAEFDCDGQRLAAALRRCREDAQLAQGEGKPGWDDAIAIGEHAMALLHRHGAQVPGPARAALRSELEEWQFPTYDPYRQGLWHRHRLPRRLLRRLNPWWLARRRQVNDQVCLEHYMDELRGYECIKIHLRDKTTGDRARSDVGRMYFKVCDQCRRVLLAKMSVDDDLQGLGLGTHAIDHAIDRTHDYTWYTTGQYDTARSYWQRIARRTGAGFRGPEAGVVCKHMRDTDTNASPTIDQ
jgi:GNAT superfamily N-acetyltransferase